VRRFHQRPVDVISTDSKVRSFCLCELARTQRRFSMMDHATGETQVVDTEHEVADLARARYDGAVFVLTTMENLYDPGTSGGLVSNAGHDLVVMAICRPAGLELTVVAYIFGPVHGPHCVPFSPQAWPWARNYLRRPTGKLVVAG